MTLKLLAIGLIFCSAAYGASNTKSVGTAIARGEIRVDGNQVSSNASLFDGSVVETADASATLNMFSNATVVVEPNTRTTTHDGYISLQQGKLDLKPGCGFVVEANGVRITPNSANAHAVIYFSNASAVVQPIYGEFLILDDQGRVLNTISSGSSQSFGTGHAMNPGQTGPATYAGSLNSLDNHAILTLLGPESKVTYELQGHKADKVAGKFALVSGAVDAKRTSYFTQEVIAERRESAMCRVRDGVPTWLIGAAAAAAAGGAAAAVVEGYHPNTPASR